MGNCHQIFKSLAYIGKKYICLRKFKTKTELAIKLLHKFTNFINSQNGKVNKFIVLIDGGYTNSPVMQAIASTPMKGFIGRYAKGRKIYVNGEEILLKNYIASLTLQNFKKVTSGETEKLIHVIFCGVTGAKSTKMVLVIDDIKNPNLAEIRPLVTNILELSAEEIVAYYSLRWREETYHQVLKEGFGAKTHKLRSLKALMRQMELIAVSYTFCEMRRVKRGLSGIFEVKNELISIANKNYILCMKGNKFKKSMQRKLLSRFAA